MRVNRISNTERSGSRFAAILLAVLVGVVVRVVLAALFGR